MCHCPGVHHTRASTSLLDQYYPFVLAPRRDPFTTPVKVSKPLQCPDAPIRPVRDTSLALGHIAEMARNLRRAWARQEREREVLAKLQATVKAQERAARYEVHEDSIIEGKRAKAPVARYGFEY
jgi:hypothetical protein